MTPEQEAMVNALLGGKLGGAHNPTFKDQPVHPNPHAWQNPLGAGMDQPMVKPQVPLSVTGYNSQNMPQWSVQPPPPTSGSMQGPSNPAQGAGVMHPDTFMFLKGSNFDPGFNI